MMRQRLLVSAFIAVLALPLCHTMAEARAGRGYSMGSRGSSTWSTPRTTTMTPHWARPMERSVTPQPRPTAPLGGTPNSGAGAGAGAFAGAAGGAAMMGRRPGLANGGAMAMARPSFAARHPFLTGLAGGMLGAGLFGMLSGHGLFSGVHGIFSFFGFLLQIALVIAVVRFLWGMFRKKTDKTQNAAQTASQNNGSPFAMSQNNQNRRTDNPGVTRQNLTLSDQDYQDFQSLLVDIQSAWSAQNIATLQRIATPEMASYFNEQLSDLASRGARNIVSDVQFLQGELSEAWREGNRSYATVAMRYSMIDVTTDRLGVVIDGSKTDPQTVTELWTFLRADGRGNWILSAIQQAG